MTTPEGLTGQTTKLEPPVTRRISTMTTGFQAPTKALVIVEVLWWCSGAGGILPARPA